MRRGERWWIRELERRERAHASERAELVATICRLAGQPVPDEWRPPAPTPEPDTDREVLEEV